VSETTFFYIGYVPESPEIMVRITEEELLRFLHALEEGEVSLQPEEEPQHVYAGNVSYLASNGWRIVIFNDCNTWDYIDAVRAPDGRSLDFDDIDDTMPMAREYMPSDEMAWRRYGIPGYCLFRCTKCGEFLEFELRRLPFLCKACGTTKI
jgi:hypothetical protein